MPDATDSLRDGRGAGGTARLTPAVSRGDAAAMAEFYSAWFERAYGLARAITRRDESFCLDVVQEAMLRVARRMKAMGSEADVERWMARVVHTAALDLLRRESRRAARERGAHAPTAAEPDVAERVEWLRAQIAALPPEDAGLMRLRYWGDRTLDEAGGHEGMSGGAAHGRIRRVLSRLRRLAKENDHG
ncbi:MAG: sigma-70 family RNA polymerase sigma factor [Phycisphaerales bacterium]|nr:sigma-70 family RNA polymerase sigma factor [Phycisphaerales bacterium]